MAQKEQITNAQLGFLLGRASRVMALRVDRAFHDEGYPIHLEHWIVLHNLSEERVHSQRALIELLGRDKTAVTRLLTQMEENDWIERQMDPEDRRSKRLSITRKGKALRDEIEPVITRVNRMVEQELPPGRLNESKTLLEEVFQILKNELEQPSKSCF